MFRRQRGDRAPQVPAPRAELAGVPRGQTAHDPERLRAAVALLDGLVATESARVRAHQPPLAAAEVAPVVVAVAEAHDPLAAEALVQAARAVETPDAPLTLAVLDALARDGSETAVAGLVDVALGSRGDLAARAVGTLERRLPTKGFHHALSRLDDGDPATRARAVDLVAFLGGQHGSEAIVPLLTDDDPVVRERAAVALGEVGDEGALLPLLVAEERERRTVRAGHSAVTWTGRVSPYLLAAAEIVTADRSLGSTLTRELPYEAQQLLEELVEPAAHSVSAGVRALTDRLPVERHTPWTVAEVVELLEGSSDGAPGDELVYNDACWFVTDRERCRRLGLEVVEERHPAAVELVVRVECADGSLSLVADREQMRGLVR